jgi:hypothetical protein
LTTDETKKTETLEGANLFLTKPVLEKEVVQKLCVFGF